MTLTWPAREYTVFLAQISSYSLRAEQALIAIASQGRPRDVLRQLKWSHCKRRGLMIRDGLCVLTAMATWAMEAPVEHMEDGLSIFGLSYSLVPSSLEDETTLSRVT